jgi:hypothetical protein
MGVGMLITEYFVKEKIYRTEPMLTLDCLHNQIFMDNNSI